MSLYSLRSRAAYASAQASHDNAVPPDYWDEREETGFCDCNAQHTIGEVDANKCSACGYPIEEEDEHAAE